LRPGYHVVEGYKLYNIQLALTKARFACVMEMITARGLNPLWNNGFFLSFYKHKVPGITTDFPDLQKWKYHKVFCSIMVENYI
jgi:hypothetical protein